MEKKATEEEALTNCSQIDQSSTLLTIHSKDEQQFLNNLLSKYKNISNNVWIGMSYINKTYRWRDGTETNFTNWSEESIRDGSDPCVELSLTTELLGEWFDVSCKKPALIVCQKKQDINLNSLKDVIENLTQILEKQNQEINSHKVSMSEFGKKNKELEDEINELKITTIPIGFLYTQLPNQSSPIELWRKTKWSEVTQQYSGLFFRAEGGGSEPFGTTQSANYSKISTIREWRYSSQLGQYTGPQFHEIKEGWSVNLSAWGFAGVLFYTTSAENRPRNTAIRIWKRIQ